MKRFFGWVIKWIVVLVAVFYIGVILPWTICSQTRAELDEAYTTIDRLQAQIHQISTSDYILELTNELCIIGIWTVDLDSFTIHTDRATFEECRIGDEYPCERGVSNFLLTTRVVITGMNG